MLATSIPSLSPTKQVWETGTRIGDFVQAFLWLTSP